MSNEPLNSSDSSDSEKANDGFGAIGKRIADLKASSSMDDKKAWKQAIAEPQQGEQESAKQEATQADYTPKVEKKAGPSFKFSFATAFWVIVGLAILVSIFSEINNKKTTDYKPSTPSSQQYTIPPSTDSYKPITQTNPQYSPSVTNDQDLVTVGKYTCTRSHHMRAQELKPSDSEEQSIKSDQTALDSLKTQIETNIVDRYSQYSVDRHNQLIDDYNSKNQSIQSRIDQYNNRVNTYNNYLMSNCSRAN